MNWYKKAELEDILDINELLDWLSGDTIKSAQIRRKPGGNIRSKLTPEQQKIIRRKNKQGIPITQIAQEIGSTTGSIRNYLVNEGLKKPNPVKGTGGILYDRDFVNDFLKLRNTTNPDTGKPYNKAQLKRELGVSSQIIDRAIGLHDIKTPDDLALYVSYQFWDKYSGGIKNTLGKMKAKDRVGFVSDFIDTLFENPKNRASAKEALFHKLKMRNEMLHGNKAVPPPTQLIEPEYNPDFEDEEPDKLRPKSTELTDSGVWNKRQQQQQENPQKVSDKYDPARIDMILQEYIQNGYGSYQKLANKHGISMYNLRAIILENGLPIKKNPGGRPKKVNPQQQPIPQQQQLTPQQQQQQMTLRQQMKSLGDWYVQQDALKARPERELDEEYRRRRAELNSQYA